VAEEVCARKFDAYLGSNRTCEIGLNLATGKDYESFVYLLEELTRPILAGQTMTSAQDADSCPLEKGAAE
jgi:D-lactate dehydrogenase